MTFNPTFNPTHLGAHMTKTLAVIACLTSSLVLAQAVPGSIAFNARLTDTGGAPVTGSHALNFSLYDTGSGGAAMWNESVPGAAFSAEGVAFVELGAVTPLSTTVLDGRKLYLEVAVDGTTMSPRLAIVSVPYAVRASVANSALQVGTLTESAIQRRVTGTCNAGQAVRSIDAAGGVQCETVSAGGGGDITGVTTATGSGLTGGSASGDVALSLAPCAASEVLKYNGTAWACAPDGLGPTYTVNAPLVLTSSAISLTGCANGQVLKSNGTSWACAADSTGSSAVATPTTDGLMAAEDKRKANAFGGWGYIPNTFFEGALDDWQVVTGSGTIGTTSAPFAGVNTFTNATNVAPWLGSTRRVPVNPQWTFRVSGSFRRLNLNGSAGAIYLAVRLFTATGADIAGDGTWWFYPVSNVTLTDTNWRTYTAEFGSGTARPFPANAAYMSVGAILNYDGAVAGNRNYEVTALTLTNTNRPPLFITDNRPGCPPAFVNNGAMITSTFTLDRPSYVSVSSTIISLGTGRRDSYLVVDGAEVNRWISNSFGVNDWFSHYNQWVGSLAAGAHTISMNGNQSGPTTGFGCGSSYGTMKVEFRD